MEYELPRCMSRPFPVRFRLRRVLHSHDMGTVQTTLKCWEPDTQSHRPWARHGPDRSFVGSLSDIEAVDGVPLTLSIGEEVACLRMHAVIGSVEEYSADPITVVSRARIYALVRTESGLDGWVPEFLLRDVNTARLCRGLGDPFLNPIFREFLRGTADPASPIRMLRGNKYMLVLIMKMALQGWESHLDWSQPAAYRVANVTFPAPTGININMMPFIVGNSSSLPQELHSYWPMIQACERSQHQTPRCGQQVAYLTISEGLIEAGQTQRRGGVHTDMACVRRRCPESAMANPSELQYFTWGLGMVDHGAFTGGIYMASNLDDTCAVWDAKVVETGMGGDVQHLRANLGPGTRMKASELWWMTDRTPHESLPLERRAYRQYFRYVTSGISAWYEHHSTKNPLGVAPPADVRILIENKFVDVHLLVGPTWDRTLEDPATLAVLEQLESNKTLMKATRSMAVYEDPITFDEQLGSATTVIPADRDLVETYFYLEDPEECLKLSPWVVRIQMTESADLPSCTEFGKQLLSAINNIWLLASDTEFVMHIRVKPMGCLLSPGILSRAQF